jgi:hypothetical protein
VEAPLGLDIAEGVVDQRKRDSGKNKEGEELLEASKAACCFLI